MKLCLNKTYSTVQVGKHMSDNSPIKNGVQQDELSPLLWNFCFYKYSIRKVRANQEG